MGCQLFDLFDKLNICFSFLIPSFLWSIEVEFMVFIFASCYDDGCCTIAHNGSADLRSSENEVYFRSWDLAHHQIYKSIFDTQKLIKKTLTQPKAMSKESQRKG